MQKFWELEYYILLLKILILQMFKYIKCENNFSIFLSVYFINFAIY